MTPDGAPAAANEMASRPGAAADGAHKDAPSVASPASGAAGAGRGRGRGRGPPTFGAPWAFSPMAFGMAQMMQPMARGQPMRHTWKRQDGAQGAAQAPPPQPSAAAAAPAKRPREEFNAQQGQTQQPAKRPHAPTAANPAAAAERLREVSAQNLSSCCFPAEQTELRRSDRFRDPHLFPAGGGTAA